MNCFRSLYLWVDLQHKPNTYHKEPRCELLSFFVPLGWFTAVWLRWNTSCWLWIAFVLCTFGLIYSNKAIEANTVRVVNCFRSLYLWVDLQPYRQVSDDNGVVNCFRSLYLWVDLQHSLITSWRLPSCELLSFFVPLGWFTAHNRIFWILRSCELLSFFVPLGWFTANLIERS